MAYSNHGSIKTILPDWGKFSYIDLFCGIGGFRLALDKLGGNCVFSSDYDKFAQTTYEANFGEKPLGDITKIKEDDIPLHDVLCAGFPCQPFSIAGVSKKNSLGKKHGFEDEKQGNLFFDIIRIAKFHQPKILFLENVKNLKSHDNGNSWKIITSQLENAGYYVFSQIIDAKFFVPQHRQRIFIVCFQKDAFCDIDFHFPSPPKARIYELPQIIEQKVESKYTLSNHLWQYLKDRKLAQQEKGNGFGYGLVEVGKHEYTRTLSARYYKDGSEILISQDGGANPRRLTPRECARLLGFPEEYKIVVSNTQSYKQFGNSIAPPVVYHIFKTILKTLSEYQKGKARKKQANLFSFIQSNNNIHAKSYKSY